MPFKEYWRSALTHPDYGYYMKRDVFNQQGDFVTSVEISQMFCQVVGVWALQYFMAKQFRKSPNDRVRIVEVGPGRGTLAKTILKTFHQLKQLQNVEYCLVQVSGFLKNLQQQNVLDGLQACKVYMRLDHEEKGLQKFVCDQAARNLQLSWFSSIQEYLLSQRQPVPTLIIAHQLFDALPASLFQFTEQGWKENHVGLSENLQSPLQFVHMPAEKPPNISVPVGTKLQINLQAGKAARQLVASTAGFGALLAIDYGDKNPYSDSIRAIRNHMEVPWPHWLQLPGQVDLSFHVDFGALGKGPILRQGQFLQLMGMKFRMQNLLQSADNKTSERIKYQYDRLTHKEQMGEIYKVMLLGEQNWHSIFPFNNCDSM